MNKKSTTKESTTNSKTTKKVTGSKKTVRISRDRISVIQYNLKGKKIKKFNSITEASRTTGVNTGSISKVSRGLGKSAGGFRWSISQ